MFNVKNPHVSIIRHRLNCPHLESFKDLVRKQEKSCQKYLVYDSWFYCSNWYLRNWICRTPEDFYSAALNLGQCVPPPLEF